MSDPVSEYVKDYFGCQRAIGFLATFGAGALGSIMVHPFDTAVTRWQEDKVVAFSRRLLKRGSGVRAVAVADFSVCYKLANEVVKLKGLAE